MLAFAGQTCLCGTTQPRKKRVLILISWFRVICNTGDEGGISPFLFWKSRKEGGDQEKNKQGKMQFSVLFKAHSIKAVMKKDTNNNVTPFFKTKMHL